MFGDNPVRKQQLSNGESLTVQAVFPTIQGEGPFAGRLAMFVRLWGCNLRCTFCDTDFESNQKSWPVKKLVDYVKAYAPPHCNLVVLTGGEPFRQNIAPLCAFLIREGYNVQIETAGTLWIPDMASLMSQVPFGEPRLTVVCSPKTGKIHPKLAPYIDAWKYILNVDNVSPEDGLPIHSTQQHGQKVMALARPTQGVVYVQAMDEYDKDRNKANLEKVRDVALRYGYNVSFQIHKALGVP